MPWVQNLRGHAPIESKLLEVSKFISLFILREREHTWRGIERDRERESQASSMLLVEPDVGLDLTNCEIMTRAETESQTLNPLSHPGAPKIKKF